MDFMRQEWWRQRQGLSCCCCCFAVIRIDFSCSSLSLTRKPSWTLTWQATTTPVQTCNSFLTLLGCSLPRSTDTAFDIHRNLKGWVESCREMVVLLCVSLPTLTRVGSVAGKSDVSGQRGRAAEISGRSEKHINYIKMFGELRCKFYDVFISILENRISL